MGKQHRNKIQLLSWYNLPFILPILFIELLSHSTCYCMQPAVRGGSCHAMLSRFVTSWYHKQVPVYVQFIFRREIPQSRVISIFFLFIGSLISGGLHQRSRGTVGISGDRLTSKCLDPRGRTVGIENFL